MDYSERDRSGSELQDGAPNWLRRSSAAAAPRRTWSSGYGHFSDSTSWLVNLALLVAFCAVVTGLATLFLREWHAGSSFTTAAFNVLAPVPPASARAADPVRPTPFAVNLELENQARLKTQQEADLRRKAAVQQTLAEEEAVRRRAALEARREIAWRAAYVKPPQCDEAQPTNDSIGCANDYIRARRKFDEQFLAASRR